ncbi:MAG: tRNA (N6-threonylcarbamoyladenosine(37)-N6)-methyltransferase TrmO [Deltaproteobacteria bacterium]|nr:tRNA (N6-threonylcarbamoyladenosine(37)-N6)-methyltransferase TrmO [Deltaproteobacteria bacterium]
MTDSPVALAEPRTLTLTPIGVVRSPFRDRAEAPRQARAGEGIEATIELYAGRQLERALFDLEGWDYLWVLFWFDRNEGWRPQVLPPRSERRRGVFSTRAPYRPNPIGMSVVRLLEVKKLTLRVQGCDILDQTPVLDLKPYVPWSDAIPNARTGWLAPPDYESQAGEDGRPEDPKALTAVSFEPLATQQLQWLLESHRIDLEPAIRHALSLGTKRHPYKRLQRDGDLLRLAIKAWRVLLRDEGAHCTVLAIASGYRAEAIAQELGIDEHVAFVARFGQGFSR